MGAEAWAWYYEKYLGGWNVRHCGENVTVPDVFCHLMLLLPTPIAIHTQTPCQVEFIWNTRHQKWYGTQNTALAKKTFNQLTQKTVRVYKNHYKPDFFCHLMSPRPPPTHTNHTQFRLCCCPLRGDKMDLQGWASLCSASYLPDCVTLLAHFVFPEMGGHLSCGSNLTWKYVVVLSTLSVLLYQPLSGCIYVMAAYIND